MIRTHLLFSACLLSLFITQVGRAQSVSVQQPVVESFGVATTVVVPDQGTAYLGSLGTARESRKFFGPRLGLFPPGSSASREVTHRGVTVSARIHDFESMDRALLAKPAGSPPLPFEHSLFESTRGRNLYGVAEITNPADQSRRRFAKPTTSSVSSPEKPINPLLMPGQTARRIATRYYEQGHQAEQQGNITLAKIYYRLAVRNGSLEAQRRLKLIGQGSR